LRLRPLRDAESLVQIFQHQPQIARCRLFIRAVKAREGEAQAVEDAAVNIDFVGQTAAMAKAVIHLAAQVLAIQLELVPPAELAGDDLGWVGAGPDGRTAVEYPNVIPEHLPKANGQVVSVGKAGRWRPH
jgi:hypothetical protein